MQVSYTGEGAGGIGEGEVMVRDLQGSREAVDQKLAASRIRIFGRGGDELGDDYGADVAADADDDDVSDDDISDGDISDGSSGEGDGGAGTTDDEGGSGGEEGDSHGSPPFELTPQVFCLHLGFRVTPNLNTTAEVRSSTLPL